MATPTEIMVLPFTALITNSNEYEKLKKPLRKREASEIHDLLLSDVFTNSEKEKINLISVFQPYQVDDFVNRNIEFDIEDYMLMSYNTTRKEASKILPLSRGMFLYSSTGELHLPDEVNNSNPKGQELQK